MDILEDWKIKLSEPVDEAILDANNERFYSWDLNGQDIKCKSILFRNIVFTQRLTLNSLNLIGNILFDNCTIHELQLNNCNLSREEGYVGGLFFHDSKIDFKFTINNCKIKHGRITIKDSTIRHLHVIKTEVGGDRISIDDTPCFQVKFLEVKSKSIEFNRIDIRSFPYSFNSEVSFENCNANHLWIIDCKLQAVRFQKLHLNDTCLIQESEINKFYFRSPVIPFGLVCKSCTIKDMFHISLEEDRIGQAGFQMKSILLNDCSLGNRAMIYGAREKVEVDFIGIIGRNDASGSLDLENISVKHLQMNYTSTLKMLRLVNVGIGKLEMEYLQNTGNIYFTSVKPYGKDAHWSISHSQTGKWHLHDCSFEDLFYLEISNSDLEGLRYVSVIWFKFWMLIPPYLRGPSGHSQLAKKVIWFKRPKFEEHAKEARNRREVYRMFKEAAEKQNDRIQSLRFQMEEMNAHQRELRLTQRFYNPDRLVLWAGRSNNHGLNWWKPVLLALGISVFFYVAIIIGIDPSVSFKDIFYSGRAWGQIFSHWGLFPQLLNPVHSLTGMASNTEVIHPLTWYLDYLHRLVMAFFIFQTVAAFRKFIRT